MSNISDFLFMRYLNLYTETRSSTSDLRWHSYIGKSQHNHHFGSHMFVSKRCSRVKTPQLSWKLTHVLMKAQSIWDPCKKSPELEKNKIKENRKSSLIIWYDDNYFYKTMHIIQMPVTENQNFACGQFRSSCFAYIFSRPKNEKGRHNYEAHHWTTSGLILNCSNNVCRSNSISMSFCFDRCSWTTTAQ